jgi:hypothetical protein
MKSLIKTSKLSPSSDSTCPDSDEDSSVSKSTVSWNDDGDDEVADKVIFGPRAPVPEHIEFANASQLVQQGVPSHPEMLTVPDLICAGLLFAGFDKQLQYKAGIRLTLRRFKAFFGEDPAALVPLFSDLKNKYPLIKLKDYLMTLNWFKGYDSLHVLAGRWKQCENYISSSINRTGTTIQSLKSNKIKFDFSNKTYKSYCSTYDTVNFKVNELRLDPSSKWFDPKSHSAGLVSLICNMLCHFHHLDITQSVLFITEIWICA